MGFVDLHSHILPGLDDGARNAGESMDMISGLASLGFDTVCATPHQKAEQFLPSAEEIGRAHDSTLERVRTAGVDVTIPLAAENMWDGVFFERLQGNCIPGYDGSDAFLVEFRPSALPVGLDEHIFRLCSAGKLPVIAHPERYQPLWKKRDKLEQLAEQCVLVVDLGAVAGYHGRQQTRAARKMLQHGIAHAVASDCHSPADIRVVAEGMAWIRKKLGAAALERLLDENPRRVLAGEYPGS